MDNNDLRLAFLKGMEQFFVSIPNGVRKSTEEHLSALPDLSDAEPNIEVRPDGFVSGFIGASNETSKFEVRLATAPDGSVGLRVEMAATDFKTAAALIDAATAGFCGLDGVVMIEEWARR